MISGRIQPAMEETAQEILQAVENIEVQVEGTSGVIVGADGKKYKAVMEETLIPVFERSNGEAIMASLFYDDDYGYGFSGSILKIYNRQTLETIATVTLIGNNIGALSGIPIYNAPMGIATNSDYIFITSKSSAGSGNAALLFIVQKSNLKQLSWIHLPFDSAYDLIPRVHNDHLYIARYYANSMLRVEITRLVEITSGNMLTGQETIALTNIVYGGLQNPVAILGYKMLDNYMLLYLKNSGNTINFIAKYNIFQPTETSFVGFSSTNTAYVCESFTRTIDDNKTLFVSGSFATLVNNDTLEYEIFTIDTGSECMYEDGNGIWAVYGLGKFENLSIMLRNIYDRSDVKVLKIDDPLSSTRASTSAGNSRIHANVDNELFLVYPSNPFAVYSLIDSHRLLGYKEVIDNVAITE